MEKYFAWLKELVPIQYDNSKSIYQITSEIISLLLKIKDGQNNFAETIDTDYTNITTKITNMTKQLDDYITLLTNNINNFKNITNTSLEDITKDINTLVNNYTNNSLTLMNNYTQNINSNESTFKEDILMDYTMLLDKINNYLANYLSKFDYFTTFKNAIDNHYATQFSTLKKDDYITINYWQNTTPENPTENELWYNPDTNILYKYYTFNNILGWNRRFIHIYQLYNYNNKLYYGTGDITSTPITFPDCQLLYLIDNDSFIYYDTTTSKINKYIASTNTKIEIGTPTLPENFNRFIRVYTLNDSFYLDRYYIVIRIKENNNYIDIMYTTTDWLTYTKISLLPDNITSLNFQYYLYYVYDNTLYFGFQCYYLENPSDTSTGKWKHGIYSTTDNINFTPVDYVPVMYLDSINKYILINYEWKTAGNLNGGLLYFSDSLVPTNLKFLHFVEDLFLGSCRYDDDYIINQYYGVPSLTNNYFDSLSSRSLTWIYNGIAPTTTGVLGIYDIKENPNYYDTPTKTFMIKNNNYYVNSLEQLYRNNLSAYYLYVSPNLYNIKFYSKLSEYTGG